MHCLVIYYTYDINICVENGSWHIYAMHSVLPLKPGVTCGPLPPCGRAPHPYHGGCGRRKEEGFFAQTLEFCLNARRHLFDLNIQYLRYKFDSLCSSRVRFVLKLSTC
jgi:hypothetical protein